MYIPLRNHPYNYNSDALRRILQFLFLQNTLSKVFIGIKYPFTKTLLQIQFRCAEAHLAIFVFKKLFEQGSILFEKKNSDLKNQTGIVTDVGDKGFEPLTPWV